MRFNYDLLMIAHKQNYSIHIEKKEKRSRIFERELYKLHGWLNQNYFTEILKHQRRIGLSFVGNCL